MTINDEIFFYQFHTLFDFTKGKQMKNIPEILSRPIHYLSYAWRKCPRLYFFFYTLQRLDNLCSGNYFGISYS